MASNKGTDPYKVRGQTISIRYYVETRVKPRPYFYEGKVEDGYPVYVQIGVKNQLSQRRSVLGAYIPPTRLDQFLRDNLPVVTEETNGFRARIMAHNPFESANFSLKHALDGYSALQEDVCYVIGKLLMYDYQDAFVGDLVERMRADLRLSLPEVEAGQIAMDDTTEQTAELQRQARAVFYRGKVGETVHPRIIFGEVLAFALPANKRILALRDEYGTYFWSLERYCDVLKLQLIQPIITLDFFLSPGFKSEFVKLWNIDAYNSVNEGFNKLVQSKSELKKLIGQ